MKCNKCGNPLPDTGIVCKFCGTLMDQGQINYQNKMKDKNDKRIMLLSEKYGYNNKVEYREEKENKVLGLLIIVIVIVFLIILTILLNK
ncbi:hypothetical protein EGR52_06560 [bacterium]|nr:hypothetical protein [bacterium]